MKKLVFTAIAMIAFSSVSFAGNVEVKKDEPKKVVVVDRAIPAECVKILNYYLVTCGESLHDAVVHANNSKACQ